MNAIFWTLWVLCAGQRLVELRISKAHQVRLRKEGFVQVERTNFEMITAHALWFACMGLEGLVIPFVIPVLQWSALTVFLGAQVLRIWTLRTLGSHWNISVMAPADGEQPDSFVSSGPYQFVRHPNYLVVILEVASLPLAGGAIFTALLFSVWNWKVLRNRVALEDRSLAARAGYREVMGEKPAFFPRVSRLAR